MTETATRARLKTRYLEEIRPALIERFGYSSPMQAPKLEKITLNMGVGLAKQDSKMLKAAQDQLATIAGQQPSVRRARKSIAAFKLREGMPVGLAVTLRSERGYEFLDRLVSIAIPRIRDFRGLNPRSFDGRGNYTLGVKEQIIFPEIDYDGIDQVRGLDITITTSAKTDAEAFALLMAFGMPFSTKWRPKGFDEAIGVESEPTDEDGARVTSPDRASRTATRRQRAPPRPSLRSQSPHRTSQSRLSPPLSRPMSPRRQRQRPSRTDRGRAGPTPPRMRTPRTPLRKRAPTDGQDLDARQAGPPAKVQDACLYSLQPLWTSARGLQEVRGVPHLSARARPQRPDPRDDEVLLVGLRPETTTEAATEPMSMTDPIADFLTRVRNAIHAAHETVEIPASKTKAELARILAEQGYIDSWSVVPAARGGGRTAAWRSD